MYSSGELKSIPVSGLNSDSPGA